MLYAVNDLSAELYNHGFKTLTNLPFQTDCETDGSFTALLYSHFIPDRKSLVLMLGGAIINLMAELFLKYLHAFKQIICEHWRNI